MQGRSKLTRWLRQALTTMTLFTSGGAWASTGVTLTEGNAEAGAWSFTMVSEIPTLAEWGMILLLLSMAAVALWQLKRRPGISTAALTLLALAVTSAGIAGIASSPLGVAGHDPFAKVNGVTMRNPTQPLTDDTSVQIIARLAAEGGVAVTGMTLHYQKVGEASWLTVAGAQWGQPTCTDCWAADLPLAGFAALEEVAYYVSASFDSGDDAFLFDGVNDPCAGVTCGASEVCLDGACVCDTGTHGAGCAFTCSDGTQNGDETGEDCGGPCAECTVTCPGAAMEDNGDGTATDPCTNLTWSIALAPAQRHNALQAYCANNTAGLSGTGWRLANWTELRSTLRGCTGGLAPGGACSIVDPGCLDWSCNDDCGCSGSPNPCQWDPVFGDASACESANTISASELSNNPGRYFSLWVMENSVGVQNLNPSFNYKGRCVRCADGMHGDSCSFTCSDGAQNGEETGEDCGGPCDACAATCPTGTEMVPNGDTTGKTLTDPATCLVWQKTAPADMKFSVATTYCDENQGGLPGEGWRLPTYEELRSLVRGCEKMEPGGGCNIGESGTLVYGENNADCNDGCGVDAGPAGGCYWDANLVGDCEEQYWSTAATNLANIGWTLIYNEPRVSVGGYPYNEGTRCVRTGP